MDVDVCLARLIIVLKAKDLGMEGTALSLLDAVVCEALGVEDADPLIFPAQQDN